MSLTQGFVDEFERLLQWRRDVRHFASEPISDELVEHLLDLACLAPSVGNSQPWRFVSVDEARHRSAVVANFSAANAHALQGYEGERAERYANLKLAGLGEAPRQFAVFCDEDTSQGHGLGSRTMPEMLRYSTALAVHTLWLAARAHDIGVGWVSIIDPERMADDLDVPRRWKLVAYLCLGRSLDESTVPELERVGWQARSSACRQVIYR
ncbi:5,6-dimethylbenzimidazole synthase [Catellatospora citrea]|uniref:5,6-dimethylbenzimidazole synthase n=1 Tax=Catellatospora citrea TaxID=53366 RepID=A0A8J3NXK2_9ACTN|nr:5,6-dimethylbenzimidazole synthase [Catellatospora citrea]RKE11078.1 cob(II)yrinic acid a,c-diamide reductase [Catellatospora citrea]GIF96535.1 5,6-dimethylbenzimidazole synthase [Catellatospora citrea]